MSFFANEYWKVYVSHLNSLTDFADYSHDHGIVKWLSSIGTTMGSDVFFFCSLILAWLAILLLMLYMQVHLLPLSRTFLLSPCLPLQLLYRVQGELRDRCWWWYAYQLTVFVCCSWCLWMDKMWNIYLFCIYSKLISVLCHTIQSISTYVQRQDFHTRILWGAMSWTAKAIYVIIVQYTSMVMLRSAI